MDPWYKVATPRKEVREGRSFNPDEFAIHLEQVIAKTAPEDYRDPKQFFARTCFTRALREHTGMVLRRLAGETANTAPVLTLITQFGGGKTHTLTTLYHLVTSGASLADIAGVGNLLKESGLNALPQARVAAFVGNAWDPKEGRETPWIDIARQLAGDKGVKELGPSAKTTPPGTESLGRVFQAAEAPVLILFDEVLNFMNRHRGLSDQFYAFIQNLTVAMTAMTRGVAVISLPRSQVEMTDWDKDWQDKITKVVRRVAKDLIANDEAEISEVVRRRLFEDIGSDRVRANVAKTFADWCFERRAQLPPECTAVDTAATEAKAREYLRSRFEAAYPFHPATLSVFQRKWQALPQYQQTRGTLAMLAQWVCWAYRTSFTEARREPLISLGSAPLDVAEFQSVVLGQIGESRLLSAIQTDISGQQAHARALDADTKGALKNIHRRVGTAIFFECSGGQIDKMAHLPELRFALGEPEVDTTSVDNAAMALEDKSYFIRKVGTDGFKMGHQPTMKKVVNDRRASLDDESEIKPAMRKLIEEEFRRGAGIPVLPFPADGSEIPDSPKLTLVVMDPGIEWPGDDGLRRQISEWTRLRGKSPRLFPGALVWCMKKAGRDMRESVEMWLAWKRVAAEVAQGTFPGELEPNDRAEIKAKLSGAEEAAKDEVWGGYRYAAIADAREADGLKIIDLGAGHSSTGETLCGRVLTTLKTQALLNESVGAGYIERNWPPALKESGAWPLASLRQSFLNGSLTRLLDPDGVLRGRITEFVGRGEFGLASGPKPDGTYDRMWFNEPVNPEEVSFDSGVFLLTKGKSESLRKPPTSAAVVVSPVVAAPDPVSQNPMADNGVKSRVITYRIAGELLPEMWNRLGTKILPKLRNGKDLQVGINIAVGIAEENAAAFESEIHLVLEELGLVGKVRLEK